MEVEVRYLEILWNSRREVVTVVMANDPLRIEDISEEGNRKYEVETVAYPKLSNKRGAGVYIGFFFPELQENVVPQIVHADDSKEDLTPVDVANGTENYRFWVQLGKWSKQDNFYYSDLYNRVGKCTVQAGNFTITVKNSVANFTVEDLAELLSDFNDGLLDLITLDESSLKMEVADSGRRALLLDNEKIRTFFSFFEYVEKIIKEPNHLLLETQQKLDRRKVKPVSKTFQEYSVVPFSKNFTSRSHIQSLNTPENKYIYYLLKKSLDILEFTKKQYSKKPKSIDVSMKNLDKQIDIFSKTELKIDREIFYNQYQKNIDYVEEKSKKLKELNEELKNKINNVVDKSNLSTDYNFRPGYEFHSDYKYRSNNFKDLWIVFTLKNRKKDKEITIDNYKIEFCYKGITLTIEDFIEEYCDSNTKSKLLQNARFNTPWMVLSYNYSLSSIFNDYIKESTKINSYKFGIKTSGCLCFEDSPKTIKAPIKIVLEKVKIESVYSYNEKKEKEKLDKEKNDIEKANWTRNLTKQERQDWQFALEELKSRKLRLIEFKEKIESAEPEIKNLINYGLKLKKFFEDNRIDVSVKPPFSMVFLLNFNYSNAILCYQKLINSFGVSDTFLESIFNNTDIGLCDSWNIYEKWCLIKIIQSLIAVGYIPDKDWKQKLINSTQLRNQSGLKNNDIIFPFFSSHVDFPKIVLRYDSSFKNSFGKVKRPDFILEFEFEKDKSSKAQSNINNEQDNVSPNKLILDAKFKDWTENELQETLDELYSPNAKDYSFNEQYPVFLIHPKGQIVTNQLSPLSWGKDCDYGGLQNHKKGHIFLSPSIASLSSFINLRRLILMFIQTQLPDICPTCGTRMNPKESITRSGLPKFTYDCPGCHKKIYENHCKSCGTPLFKNGPIWTYHLTKADSVFNIICPTSSCHDFFEIKRTNNIDEECGYVYSLKHVQKKSSFNPKKGEVLRDVVQQRQTKSSFNSKIDDEYKYIIDQVKFNERKNFSNPKKGNVPRGVERARQMKSFSNSKIDDEYRNIIDEVIFNESKNSSNPKKGKVSRGVVNRRQTKSSFNSIDAEYRSIIDDVIFNESKNSSNPKKR